MATNSGRFNSVSLVADEALAANRLVDLSLVDAEAAKAKYVATTGDDVIGATLNDAAAEAVVGVQVEGIAMVEAGGAIDVSVSRRVRSDDSGKAVSASATQAAVGYYIGNGDAASGDIISVLLKYSDATAT